MATGQTTTSQVASARTEFFDKTLLVRALPYLAHDRFGQKRPLPQGNSKQIKFRRYDALSVATTPLSEGVAPDKTQLSVTDVTATIQQFGAYVEITDMVDLTNVESVLTETAMLLGEQAGQSLDQIWRDVLAAGSNVRYGTGVAGRDSVTNLITTADIEICIRLLFNNNAKMFTSMVKASDGVGTNPIRPAYFAIVHPDVYYTLNGLTGFISSEQYGSSGAVTEGEVGAYKNVRFVMSTFAKVIENGGAAYNSSFKCTNNGAKDVYLTMIFGKDAYGITDLQGQALRNIRKGFGTAGTADPLDQIATSGWKATTVCKILNDSFMTRIENAASI